MRGDILKAPPVGAGDGHGRNGDVPEAALAARPRCGARCRPPRAPRAAPGAAPAAAPRTCGRRIARAASRGAPRSRARRQRRPARWRPPLPAGGAAGRGEPGGGGGVSAAAAGRLLVPAGRLLVPAGRPEPRQVGLAAGFLCRGAGTSPSNSLRDVPGACPGVEAAGGWLGTRGPCLPRRLAPAGEEGPRRMICPGGNCSVSRQIHNMGGDGENH